MPFSAAISIAPSAEEARGARGVGGPRRRRLLRPDDRRRATRHRAEPVPPDALPIVVLDLDGARARREPDLAADRVDRVAGDLALDALRRQHHGAVHAGLGTAEVLRSETAHHGDLVGRCGEGAVPDDDPQVVLGVNVHLLGAPPIVEGQLVAAVGLAAHGACPPSAPGGGLRQLERRAGVRVVQATDHHGLVDVAAEEGDEHLHADSRHELRAPPRAGPGLHHPDPARALFVEAALAVPEELDLDSPEVVGVDLLLLGADDDRRRAHLAEPARRGPGPEGDARRDARERVLVPGVAAPRLRGVPDVSDSVDDVGRRLLALRAGAQLLPLGEREDTPREHGSATAGAPSAPCPAAKLFEVYGGTSVSSVGHHAGVLADDPGRAVVLVVREGLRVRVALRGSMGVVLRAREVVGAFEELRRLQRTLRIEAMDVVLGARHPRVGRTVDECGDPVVGAWAVAEDEGLAGLVVPEEVEDALLCQKAVHEGQVRLPVLDAVGAGGAAGLPHSRDLPARSSTASTICGTVASW